MRRLLCGLAFLSRLPVPRAGDYDAADLGKATLTFPVVGALIGGIEALALWVIGAKLPAMLGAMMILVVHALVTGALHLDGLADMADGFGGGRTREDVLRIMRDHHIGAYGVVALILLLGVKAAALASLLATGSWRVLVVAAALGRFTAVPLARSLPYARKQEGGLGAALTDHVGPGELLGATVLAAAISIALVGPRAAAYYGGATVAVIWGVGATCKERIGGVTGDTMGAASELAEAFIYVLAVVLG